MPGAVCIALAVAIHDRRGRWDTKVMRLPDDPDPCRRIDLLRADHSPDTVHQDLGRRSAERREAGRLHSDEHLLSGKIAPPRGVCHLHRVARVDVDGGRFVPYPGVDIDVGLGVKPRVEAAHRADLGHVPLARLPGLLSHDGLVVAIYVGIAWFSREPAEPAGVHAEVGHVDVLVPDVGDDVTYSLFPEFIGGSGDRPDIPVPGRKEADGLLLREPVAGKRIAEQLLQRWRHTPRPYL
ncbi:hypothetical protein DSECCO2_418700 [anaerobic digester metagenome]